MTPSGSGRYLMRAVLCLTVGSAGLLWCGRAATAQAQVGLARSAPDAVVPAAVAVPGPTARPSDRSDMVNAAEAEGAKAIPCSSRRRFRPVPVPGGTRDQAQEPELRVGADLLAHEGLVTRQKNEPISQRTRANAAGESR
jgi:hypothetical protein